MPAETPHPCCGAAAGRCPKPDSGYGVVVVVVVVLVVVVVVGIVGVADVVVVLAGAKPHFLPLVFGAAFLCLRLPFPGHGFDEWGTPPLSAWTKTGAEAARASPVTSTATFRVRNFTNYLRV